MQSDKARLRETRVSCLYNHTFGMHLTTPSQLILHWVECPIPRFPRQAEVDYVSLRPHGGVNELPQFVPHQLHCLVAFFL